MSTLLTYLGIFWVGGLCGMLAMACCAVARRDRDDQQVHDG